MKGTFYDLKEEWKSNSEVSVDIDSIQQAVRVWLTKELNTPTNDARPVLSARTFTINPCQAAAHKV